jgi:hypothetical protein
MIGRSVVGRAGAALTRAAGETRRPDGALIETGIMAGRSMRTLAKPVSLMARGSRREGRRLIDKPAGDSGLVELP